MICVICGMRIEKEDGWLEKRLGISGYSVLYHESCFLSSHVAHLTKRALDGGTRPAQFTDSSLEVINGKAYPRRRK